jgi:predicted O-methyltransferase YrrM
MNFLWSVKQYLRYYLKAQTIYNIHSPLAASVITAYEQKPLTVPDHLKEIRKSLLKSQRIIEMTDYGAGSKKTSPHSARVGEVAGISLSRQKEILRICNLCRFVQPSVILELGSSFGLSALHLQGTCPEAEIITVEGNPEIADIARSVFDLATPKRPEIVNARFGDALLEILQRFQKIDFVFIDGDHTLNGTRQNVTMILPYLHNDSMMVIHDIYWSEEMIQAWQECANMKEVSLSIDFFHLGILMFKREITEKLKLTVIPYYLKPWKIGLF